VEIVAYDIDQVLETESKLSLHLNTSKCEIISLGLVYLIQFFTPVM